MSLTERVKKFWRPVMGTIGAILSGVYLSAIFHAQPNVPVNGGPTLTPVDSTHYRLANDYTTTVGRVTITIQAGFVTDGASIPSVAWSPLGLSPWSPPVIRGAVIHDALYASRLVDQQAADSILYAAILQDGTEPHKARAIYRAVTDCGRIVWDRNTAERIEKARRLVKVEMR